MKKKLISIIVPAYKQEKTIKEDLENFDDALKNSLTDYLYEIICVVDGEVDKTFLEAQKVTRIRRSVKVIGYEKNRGKGHAVRYGMVRSRGEIVAFIDAGTDLDKNSFMMALQH